MIGKENLSIHRLVLSRMKGLFCHLSSTLVNYYPQNRTTRRGIGESGRVSYLSQNVLTSFS